MTKELSILTPLGFKTYTLSTVANSIKSSTPSIMDSEEYKDAKDRIIDQTMSCDAEEALRWFDVEMREALSKGIGQPDIALRAQFLAAYDLQQSVAQSCGKVVA